MSSRLAEWRAALAQGRFFAGSGAPTGLLIDCLERFGLDAMGQVGVGVGR